MQSNMQLVGDVNSVSQVPITVENSMTEGSSSSSSDLGPKSMSISPRDSGVKKHQPGFYGVESKLYPGQTQPIFDSVAFAG
jgi:hypothetical protein